MLALSLSLCLGLAAVIPDVGGGDGGGLPAWAMVDPNVELVEFSAADRAAALAAGPLDWREKGAVTTPTSQGRCSTCAYFAGVAAVEGAWKLAGHPLVKLSEQEEIDCYNNGGYAMPNMERGIARIGDAPLANHSDPNITGCRGVTNCSHAKAHAFAKIDGIRGSKSHEDPDVLALLQSGPAAVSVDAGPYNEYHGGVLNCSAEGQHHVDHANALVGYGVQPPPKRCPEQPKNASYATFCGTAFLLGSGGRQWWAAPKVEPKTLEECCALCADTVGTPANGPAWNTPRCGAANWQDGKCTMMATDPTGHHLPGMANPAPAGANVSACVPFKRAPIREDPVGYWILKNSWGPGFGMGGYAYLLFGNNCMRGVTQPYICPGPACPPPPPPPPVPKIASLAECVAKAAGCKDASFVSFSIKNSVCSWYQGCTFTNSSLRRFAGNGTDYVSAVVKTTKGAPAAGTEAVGCCGDLYECARSPLADQGANCNTANKGVWDIYK